MTVQTGQAWSEILDHLVLSRKIPPPLVETWLDIGTREELEKALLWAATGGDV